MTKENLLPNTLPKVLQRLTAGGLMGLALLVMGACGDDAGLGAPDDVPVTERAEAALTVPLKVAATPVMICGDVVEHVNVPLLLDTIPATTFWCTRTCTHHRRLTAPPVFGGSLGCAETSVDCTPWNDEVCLH